ncbi:succinate dehydrogenase subunit (SDH8) [Trypanosoma cruzi cruzi]|uniref:Transmembrane protein n=1 Tax=Trypanosoma cruzi TaxID=5693 RepID=A0A2V2VT28_TRYCR|nr:succinate dehydrogenase subunit (SDH8) [Trypanosoma cruzi cruzi]PWU99511.1 hypothetical protein C4B63_9g1532c [Trypanosoma cruzi]
MTGKGGTILVSDLPMMYPSDLLRFEREGGVWGRQWQVRRKQLTFAVATATFSTVFGSYYVVSRRNTGFVLFSTFSGFTVLGFCVGSALSSAFYPNVASNRETSMMRRVWWAKECAKNWDYSQVNEGIWKAKYPHVPVPGKEGR